MRCAVVGHVEWVDFVPVERVPEPGEILTTNDHWAEPAGGGAVAAAELLRLGAETTFFTAVGRGRAGPARRGGAARARASAASRGSRCAPAAGASPTWTPGASARSPCSRSCTFGDDPLAWEELDATTASTSPATRRRSATPAEPASWSRPRGFPDSSLRGVQLDALVHSARDPAERYEPGELDPAPTLVVSTEGSDGRYVADGKGSLGACASLDRSPTPTVRATRSPPA